MHQVDFARSIIRTAIDSAEKHFDLGGRTPVIKKLFVIIGKFRFQEVANLRECIFLIANTEFVDYFASDWELTFEISRNLICKDCGDVFEPEPDKIAFLQLKFKTICPKCGKWVDAAALYDIFTRTPLVD